jgi:hypothetical protein
MSTAKQPEEEWLSLEQAAAMIGYKNRESVRRLTRMGVLTLYKRGVERVVKKSEVEEFLRPKPVGPVKPKKSPSAPKRKAS